jgi:hypothetical protein
VGNNPVEGCVKDYTQKTLDSFLTRIMANPNWQSIPNVKIAKYTGIGETSVCKIFQQAGIKKIKKVAVKHEYGKKSDCFCGKCPPGKQSDECWKKEVDPLHKPFFEPCLHLIHSRSM